jgi:CRISPR-associated exonuclease Cas4
MLGLFGEADLEGQLRESLARLELELPLIYEIKQEELAPACRELETKIAEIAKGLSHQLDLILPSSVEVDLRSEKLRLSGRLDRLAPGCTPSLIRTGQAPEEGVWRKDRLMLAGYSLLLAETHGKRIDRGLVEYPRFGLVRPVQIHSIDKARVLRIRDRVRLIREGQLPDRPEDSRCIDCRTRELCETRHSLASKFF